MVMVINEGGKLLTTTLVIAEGVSIEHRAVMALLKRHSSTETLSTFGMSKVSRGGRPVEFAKLDELQTTFLITLMRNSKVVVSFKEKLTKEFFRQRAVIEGLIRESQTTAHDWQNVRADGKQVYFQKTSVIKEFVDYATAQGSKNARMYYCNIAKMENKALFLIDQKYPSLRDVLTIKQLMQVATADGVINSAIKEGMTQGLHYKDIYVLARQRITALAKILGKSPILHLQNTQIWW
jgi:phage regulator Rha-like protein